MRYFLDTEFNDTGSVIDLISIGIVSEDGREFYAISKEFDPSLSNPWVKANVLPELEPRDSPEWMSRKQIRDEVLDFIADTPEFWAYNAAYDWVALIQLFGPLVSRPQRWPSHCMDLMQWAEQLGVSELPVMSTRHHALADARYDRELFEYLTRYEAPADSLRKTER